tara:strand:+ start:946 stop:1476 length:531 start_codon:yes stop_codon:yes gene_type:complete
MNSLARKNTLKAAKAKIEKTLTDAYNAAEEAKTKYLEEIYDDESKTDPEKYDALIKACELTANAINNWKKSAKAKKKKSIEWVADHDTGEVIKPKKATRVVSDHDALRRIKKTARNISRPRASSWLQEGALVVERGGKLPMMVLSISDNGITQVLDGGQIRHFRDLRLRPALEEDF